jgi:hypothetical protein
MFRTLRSDESGLLAYVLFMLGGIFVGPLEAVLGLAAYWLLTDDETSEDDTRPREQSAR